MDGPYELLTADNNTTICPSEMNHHANLPEGRAPLFRRPRIRSCSSMDACIVAYCSLLAMLLYRRSWLNANGCSSPLSAIILAITGGRIIIKKLHGSTNCMSFRKLACSIRAYSQRRKEKEISGSYH